MRFRTWGLRTIMFAAVLCLDWQSVGAAENTQLHDVHNALFASFLPIDELPDDARTTALLTSARDGMWQRVGNSPQIQALLTPLTDLRRYGARCGTAESLVPNGPASFASLPPPQRQKVLWQLQNCSDNASSRLAATLRNFYLVTGYGAVQRELTGISLNLMAPADYVQSHMPRLSPTRLAYDTAKDELTEKDGHPIDVLVVGSGPAGSVLAHQLRRSGRRVLLVERGSFVIPGSMETRLIEDLIDTRTSADGGIRIRNGMAVGGGSQVNVDLCFAPTSLPIRTKIESWRAGGQIGRDQFTQAELAPAYEWVKKAIGTRILSENEINANNRALWDGAKLSGLHPKLYDLNTYPPGQSPSPVTDKRSGEGQLLIAALEDRENPLGMLPDAEVRRVLFEGSGTNRRATGVEVEMRSPITEPGVIPDPNHLQLAPGKRFVIHAQSIVLSAGALGSATILLRSGVKNDHVGRGIVLHPSMPIMGRFDHHIDVLNGTEASVYVDDHLPDRGYALESMADQPVYAAIMSPGPPLHSYQMVKSFRNLAGFGVMLIDTPQNNNRIIIDDTGSPEIHYTLSQADKQRFATGIAEAIRIMFKAGAKEVYIPTTENLLNQASTDDLRPQILTSPEQADLVQKNLRFMVNRTMVTSAHMQGTNKMGSVSENSVVAQDFHVWGTENLYVVDGSIFPTSVGANPMQSIYTIAKIFADGWNAKGNATRNAN